VQRKQYSIKRFSSLRRLGPSTSVNARQPLVLATPSHFPTQGDSSNTASRPKITPLVKTLRATTLTSSPIECRPPPPSPVNATGQRRTHTVLQGTITALKLIQQIVGLAPVPGLQSLVGVVLNISEAVNNMHAADDALVELARKAGSFMVALVEEGSVNSFSHSDSMNSIIEGLTKEMNRVLGVVNEISSQRSTRFFLSAFHKEAIDDCNRQIALACGISGIQIALNLQNALDRIEAKLNLALLKIPHRATY